MSEKKITTKHSLICDICGGIIPPRTRIRMIRDDFAPELVYYEHISCPQNQSVTTTRNSAEIHNDKGL